MKLINEAALDDQFNVQVGKIQDAIAKLEKIGLNYGTGGLKPVQSQKSALTHAIDDLKKVQAMMFNL